MYCSCGLRVLECGTRSVPSKKNFNYTRVRKSEPYAPSYTMHIVQLRKSEATVRKKEKSKPEPGRGPSECTVVFIKTEFWVEIWQEGEICEFCEMSKRDLAKGQIWVFYEEFITSKCKCQEIKTEILIWSSFDFKPKCLHWTTQTKEFVPLFVPVLLEGTVSQITACGFTSSRSKSQTISLF